MADRSVLRLAAGGRFLLAGWRGAGPALGAAPGWCLCLCLVLGCPRSPEQKSLPDGGSPASERGPTVCVEQPDGCVFCASREEGVFLEPDQSRPLVCNPADDEQCVEFCSTTIPECALPWRKIATCVRASDLEFRRALFNLRTADRPESFLQGKVVDEAGKRVEGASVRVWLSWGAWPGMVPLVDEVTGKDGGFRIPLRSGPWSYSLRISHPDHATAIVDRLPAEKLDRSAGTTAKTYRLSPGQTIRGRIVDAASNLPVSGALIHAVRAADDAITVGETTSGDDGGFVLGGLETRRYVIDVSRFGWRPQPAGVALSAPASKVTLKMAQANVIRGTIVDADGVAEPNATVVAVLASAPGGQSLPIMWTSDGDGRFAQDHFVPGTYYLWARRGDMLVYPPSRIELSPDQVADVRMTLGHKGGRVLGSVQLENADPRSVSVHLAARSPLSFPRNPVAKVDEKGNFIFTGVLPGRYGITPRSGLRTLSIVSGPREIEMPIEPGRSITLDKPLVLRSRIED